MIEQIQVTAPPIGTPNLRAMLPDLLIDGASGVRGLLEALL